MWRYKLILFLLFVPLVFFTLWQSIRAFELRYFLQRLAIIFNTEFKTGGLWVHAASVGEVNAAIPLLLKIHENHPDTPITITTNTTTSASVVEQELPSSIQHIYFPLDYRWAIKRLVNKISPKVVFIVETEFWPNFYIELNKRNIPLFIINGRLSEKTIYAQSWLKKIYAEILPKVDYVYARSKKDQARFISLGLSQKNIQDLGNIKLSTTAIQNITPIDLDRPYVLVASTRDDEEQLIIEAWNKADKKNHLLVIVPRHPVRLNEISNQIKKFRCHISVRSKGELITPNTDVYIADTIGELKSFIRGSEFVLMGGSFVHKGGHNILEVAQMGKAVIFGPDMRNFEDEAELFIEYNAGVQCDLNELPNIFNAFLSDPEYKKNIEENATKLIGENNNVEKYYLALKNKI